MGDELPTTIITEAWVGAGEVFGELSVQDTVMEEMDTATEDYEEFTPSMSTPKKNYALRRQTAYLKNPRLVKGNQQVSLNLISDQDLT